ncbi:mRNA splicing factor [Moesziomyces antarcticus]|uniref:mRNA splicing factor n=2 Tax=Pseudozyma antarctica TaxID=84753 RepID=A0A081CL59_PSEA2|nr:mRNA splicing factor [Moesziomyces antarcticus]GAK67405.1 mRNA splicing factor [Moesziomyces antarcticus]SPO48657.1 probable Coiled-coil domain-containing protein 12 (CCDC12) [Moesziomyces antarcticus]
MSMEAFSHARKQKLLLLRQRRNDEQTGHASSRSNDAGLLIKRHFRNYDPITGQMRRFTSARDLPDTVEKDVDGLQQSTLADDERRRKEDLDLTNIAPKRPNWDLKRDLEKRLRRLERADKQAILLLTRQRIQAQQKAAGLDANSGDRNEASVAGLSAEIAATATADFDAASDLSQDDSESDDE